MKKIMALAMVVVISLLCFAGCGNNDEGKIKVGVIQYGAHPSLDNCYRGVEAGLKEAFGDNVIIDLQNGNTDPATCDAIAKNMASKNYDLLIPIATPAALSAYAATINTNIPVVFCAVSDPVAAGLVESIDVPGGKCTGTSDILDLNAQVDLILSLQPDVKKIGVLYTTSEANSISQLEVLKIVAAGKGIEVVAQGVQGASDIPQAALSLCSKVDCINNFTDNNVVNNLSVLIKQADAVGIPVYGSEVEQVEKGCLASVSIDYEALGRKTASLAAEILNGADVSKVPVVTIRDTTPVINKTVASSFGIKIPENYSNADFVE